MMINKSNNVQLLTLLIGHDKFQVYIKSIRILLKIPESGFSKNEEVERWINYWEEKDREYLNSKNYKRHNQYLREKMKSGELDRNMANKQLNLLLRENLHANILTDASNYVIDNFNLPSHLVSVIRRYILHNKFDFIPTDNFSYLWDIKTERVAKIEIYSRLTKNEQLSLLRLIKERTKDFPKINKITKATIKRLTFENWQKDREKYTERSGHSVGGIHLHRRYSYSSLGSR